MAEINDRLDTEKLIKLKSIARVFTIYPICSKGRQHTNTDTNSDYIEKYKIFLIYRYWDPIKG